MLLLSIISANEPTCITFKITTVSLQSIDILWSKWTAASSGILSLKLVDIPSDKYLQTMLGGFIRLRLGIMTECCFFEGGDIGERQFQFELQLQDYTTSFQSTLVSHILARSASLVRSLSFSGGFLPIY